MPGGALGALDMTSKKRPPWKRSFPPLEPGSSPSGERCIVRASVLLIDDKASDAQLLEKVLEVLMFQAMTSASARALRTRPNADAIWLRTGADPTRDIHWLRKLGFEGPIFVSAESAIPIET